MRRTHDQRASSSRHGEGKRTGESLHGQKKSNKNTRDAAGAIITRRTGEMRPRRKARKKE